jgi:branched-chain amino acid transport system substrate-binding protein
LASNPFDKRILVYAVIGLLVGGSLGYIGNYIVNESKITKLTESVNGLQITVNDQTSDIANLTASLETLKANNTVLQGSLDSLLGQSLANKTVKIGYVVTIGASQEFEERYIKEIIEPDLNEYASNLGYNLSFEIVVKITKNDLNKYLDEVIKFKSQGINLYIGGNGNGGADVSLSYASTNKMIMVSTTSNQTDFAEGQRTWLPLYRLCPVVAYTGSSLADLMWSYGIRTAAILQPGDSWGDGTENDFKDAWGSLGGTIIDAPVRFDKATTDYSTYLQQLDNQVARALQSNDGAQDRVGVLGLCRSVAPTIAMQAANYTHLFNVTWFGSNYTANSTQLVSLAGPQVARLKWISLKPEAPNSDSYSSISARYLALTGKQIDIYSAYLYDAAFLLAKSVIETQSTDGIKVGGVFQEVCNSTYGVSGWCGLDVNKDRIPPPYEIWTYTSTTSNSTAGILVGTLDPVNHEVTFYRSLG